MPRASKHNVGTVATGTPEVLSSVPTAKQKTKKQKKGSKPLLESLVALRKRAWKAWSLHIRKQASDWRGYAKCYTCGLKKPYKELQAGHFLHGVLDFHGININPQCQRCNHYINGNLANYATRLVRQYGPMVLRDLELESGKRGNKYSRAELLDIIDRCKES